MIAAIVVTVWLASAALTVAMGNGYSAGGWPELRDNWREDIGLFLVIGLLLGPLGAVLTFLMTGFARHGLRWWR